jgi:hypothetical protein
MKASSKLRPLSRPSSIRWAITSLSVSEVKVWLLDRSSFFEIEVVLHYAVMDYRHLVMAVGVRMSIGIGRFPVGCPSGMAQA